MTNNQPELRQLFESKCEDIIVSKLILSDKKISNLLKTIATNDELYALTEFCLKNFNYEVEFMKCKLPASALTSLGKYRILMPDKREKLCAFVFCLLCEFDTKQRDLQEFLSEYFDQSKNLAESYRVFLDEVIRPYESAMLSMLKEDTLHADDPCGGVSLQSYFGTEFVNFDDQTLENLGNICQVIILGIRAEKQLTLSEQQEMLEITEALMNAILTKDKKLIRSLFIGSKNTLKGFKHAGSKTVKIEKILKDFWIV